MLLALFTSALSLYQLPRPTSPKLLMCLYCFYAIKLSTTQEFLIGNFKPSIGALVVEKSTIDPLCFGLESVSLTSNMGIFKNKNIQTFIFTKMYSASESMGNLTTTVFWVKIWYQLPLQVLTLSVIISKCLTQKSVRTLQVQDTHS